MPCVRASPYPHTTAPPATIAVIATPFLANTFGWVFTEMGRQPWVVYNVRRTADAVSDHSALTLSVTLAIFIVMYFIVFGAGTAYMLKLVARGPEAAYDDPAADPAARPARPLSAAPDDADPTGGR